jgi:signal transduction histidine kinase
MIHEETLSDGLIAVDAQGRITLFSPGAEYLLGYAHQELIGQPIDKILRDPRGRIPLKEFLPPTGCAFQFDFLNKHHQPIKLVLSHALDIQENETAFQSILLLRGATEQEVDGNLKSNFLASISQEFRTPLAAIKASVELLLEELGLLSKEELSTLLESIHLSVSGLQTMIDNLLESMNIEADHFKIHRQKVGLDEVVSDAIHYTKPMLNRRQQQLTVQIDASIPHLELDPNRLTQAIVNLLSNASKYSPIGQPIDLKIEDEDGEHMRLSVADRGSGIPAVMRVELFRPFTRIAKPDEPPYGLGLGLSVVKAIVEGHGGEVGIEPREGGGTVLWFKLPYSYNIV